MQVLRPDVEIIKFLYKISFEFIDQSSNGDI